MFMEVMTKRTIEFSDEQAMMLDAAKRFVADKSPIAKVRELIESDAGFEADVWAECAQLGWTGMAVPEEFGGSAFGLGAVVPVVEMMGRGLMSTPLVPTVLAGAVLTQAGTEAQKQAYLPKIAEGAIATLALSESDGGWGLADVTATASANGDALSLSGTKALVEHADKADILIASVTLDGKAQLVVLEKADLAKASITRETVIDETRRSFRVGLDGVSVPADRVLNPAKASDALKYIELATCLLCAADAAGAADSCLGVIVEYLNTRKQFEKLIGSYQGLKHPAADILQGIEAARSHLYHAATAFDEDWQGAEVAVRMAKHQADEVACFAGDRAIQFHGGFGFTYECDAQLYRRRSIWNTAHFGDPTHQRQVLADLMFG